MGGEMQRRVVEVYEEPNQHGAISDLVRRHSTNRWDVRDAALSGLVLDEAERLLDLGCGFGFMAEGLARHSRPGTEIVGIDINRSNQSAFVDRVERTRCRGTFVWQALDGRLDFDGATFDGVVASYSLYFFPDVVGEVARVLVPGGFFVALTHRESSLRHLLGVLGLSVDDAPEAVLLRGFSAETGAARLAPHFPVVEARLYPNTLVFAAGDRGDLLTYIRFKLPLVVPGFAFGAEVPAEIVHRVDDLMERDGRIEIDKDDAIFTARRAA